MDLELHLEQLIAERRQRPNEGNRTKSRSKNKSTGGNKVENNKKGMSLRGQNNSSSGGGDKKLIGLNWSTRLTIILVGTCLLFSTFFALEFFIAKLSSILITDAATHSLANSARKCLLTDDQNPLIAFERAARDSAAELTCQLSSAASNKSNREDHSQQHNDGGRRKRRLKFDYGLIFENELAVSSDQQHYELNSQKWPISSQLRLSRLLEAHQAAMPFHPDIWLHSEPGEQMHLLWGNLSQCSLELGELLQKFHSTTKMNGLERQKLQQLLDSFGRPESGSLLAHPFWLGSHLQCQQLNSGRRPIQLGTSRNGRLETRYCVGKVVMNSWIIHEHDDDDEQQQISFKVGLCLPKSCDSLALFKQQQLMANERGKSKHEELENEKNLIEVVRKQVELLMRFNFNPNKQNGMNLFAANEIKLNDIYCLPLEESRKLNFVAFLLLFLLFLWLSTCILCTWIRRQRLASAADCCFKFIDNRLLEILAIDVNLERFLSLDAPIDQKHRENAFNLDVLDSIKHLGCIGVIGAHVFLTYLTLGTAYNHIIEHIGTDTRTMLLLSLNNVVDTFFVISGLLASYLMSKKLDNNKSARNQISDSSGNETSICSDESRPAAAYEGATNQPNEKRRWFGGAGWKVHAKLMLKMVAGRYLRMAPLYFLVYAGTKSLATHLGSGPLWDYATNSESLRGLCQRESWLWPLGFVSNLKPIAHHCVPPAWSLAVDLQFFLLMPLFMLALKHWPTRWSYSLIGLLVCLSSWSTFLDYRSLLLEHSSIVSLSDFAKLRLHVFTILIKHSARGYSQTHNRMGPILIGLLGGHLLHEHTRNLTKQEKSKEVQAAKRREWPHYMRGKWFACILLAGLLFVCAPALVRLREQARSDHHNSNSWLIRCLLALNTSTKFDTYLALAGFVLIKPLWSLCNLFVFLRLCTDLRHSLVGRLLGMSGWRTLSKLNYAILLIHFELIVYEAMSRFTQTPISWPELLCKFCFAYVCSLLAALLLHVLIERPAQKLTSWFLFGLPKHQQVQ